MNIDTLKTYWKDGFKPTNTDYIDLFEIIRIAGLTTPQPVNNISDALNNSNTTNEVAHINNVQVGNGEFVSKYNTEKVGLKGKQLNNVVGVLFERSPIKNVTLVSEPITQNAVVTLPTLSSTLVLMDEVKTSYDEISYETITTSNYTLSNLNSVIFTPTVSGTYSFIPKSLYVVIEVIEAFSNETVPFTINGGTNYITKNITLDTIGKQRFIVGSDDKIYDSVLMNAINNQPLTFQIGGGSAPFPQGGKLRVSIKGSILTLKV